MYGLVNEAFRSFISETWGEQCWKDAQLDAQVPEVSFISMEPYDDAVTYALIGSACKLTKESPEQLLEKFGVYWTQGPFKTGWYGEFIQTAGSNLEELLRNLDALHGHVKLSLPKLNPPSFKCQQIEPGKLVVQYYSPRDGLTFFVKGLLLGMGKFYDLNNTQVTIRETKQVNGDHDEFLVEYQVPE